MRSAVIAAVGTLALAAASSASSAILDVTLGGVVINGFDSVVTNATDLNGLFGNPGASLVGDSFTATFILDPSLGVATSYYQIFDYSNPAIGIVGSTTSPLLSVSLSIDSKSINFPIGLGEDYSYDYYVTDKGVYLEIGDGGGLGLTLLTSGAPSSVNELFSATGAQTGYGMFCYPGSLDLQGGYCGSPIELGTTSISVTDAVPEPTTWMLLLVGVGAAGAVYRGRVYLSRQQSCVDGIVHG